MLYDTRSRECRAFRPAGKRVSIYSCGPTLYRPQHIGNIRAYVFADTLNRALRHYGYQPKHIINLTDVGHLTDDADAGEDKIEKQAQTENSTARAITEKIAGMFFSDLEKMNISLRRYIFPRATDYIAEQIELVRALEKQGLTYDIPDGIYFNTGAYPQYGALGLSSENADDAHARIDAVEGKKSSHDFALWKRTPQGVSRQQEWDSPWGRGFPGWHAECSAMAMKLLGQTIDIHTGGADHIAVHHNNEIAQSEGATGETFAKVWMHGAFLIMEGDKMAKSVGNVYTVSDLEERGYEPLALRYLFLQSSYRTPLSFSFAALEAAQTALRRLQREYDALPHPMFPLWRKKPDNQYIEQIDVAIADNLNTAKVLAAAWDALRDTKLEPAERQKTIRYADSLLGVLSMSRKKDDEEIVPQEVTALLKKRDEARAKKAYDEADALREEIAKHGYEVFDSEKGSSVGKRR